MSQIPAQPGGTGDDGFIRSAGRGLLIALHSALRALKLYPVENATVQKALDDLQATAVSFLAAEQEIELRLSGDFMFLNSVRLRLELDNFAAFSGVLSMFRAFDIGVLRVHGQIDRREWLAFLSIMLRVAAQPAADDRYVALLTELSGAQLPNLELEPASSERDEPAGEDKERAKRAYAQGVAVTREVVNSVRLGRTSSLKKVKRAVQMIVDQVLTNETSIMGLTTLRDYDEYTFMHSVNVCIFSVALARKFGFSKLQLYDLGMTALLHDIGKARVPIEITNKTSSLDEHEWRLMQAHPWRGAMTLFGLRGYDEIPYRAILVAHEHHMKTDLTGYPRHVRPRELGLFSRIVAVADGFDAATTRRSYQTVPLEPDQVLKEMWSNPHRGYEPTIVKALINLIGVYPIGTCVILDTLEVGIVASTVSDRNALNRPLVRIAIDADGGVLAPPGIAVDLQERGHGGQYLRSIVKVTSPERYGLVPGDFFLSESALADPGERIARLFARGLAVLGPLVVAATLVLDRRWLADPVTVAVLAAATVLLRSAPVRLSKFSYLTQTGIAALVGAVAAPSSSTGLGLWTGVMLADLLLLRKTAYASLVNAGREVVSFGMAFGLYAATARWIGLAPFSIQFLPAIAVLVGAYFFASRMLFYFSLHVRDKLEPDDRIFLLRWELVTYLATLLGAALVIWALVSLRPAGWVPVGVVLAVLGFLTRTLLEEAIAAEDLNKVHMMQSTISSNVSLRLSFEQLEQLAYRLVDWGDFRIHRLGANGTPILYRAAAGRPRRSDPDPGLEPFRRRVLETGQLVLIPDTRKERGLAPSDDVRTVVIHPLRFADQSLGTLEVEHHKRYTYRSRDLAAIGAVAAQISTAIHIAELRRPLFDTVNQIGSQSQALARAANSLRASAMALATASDNMRREAATQEAFARTGLEATTQLSDRAERSATSGARAARVSQRAAGDAAKHRHGIGEAIERLLQVRGFVAASSRQVTALGATTGRIRGFLESIQELAELTNLIALNASIEATRAGEAGRGFGVVAQEIQRLAIQSGQASEEAAKLAADISAEVGGIVSEMSRGESLVAGVGAMSREAARALEAIVQATGEAGEHARTIAESEAVQEAASRRLADQIRQMAEASVRMRGNTESLASQAAEASRGQVELEVAIGELQRVAGDLQTLARQFAVEA